MKILKETGMKRLMTDVESAYMRDKKLHEIDDRYQTANTWYRARSVCIGTTGLTWLYSLVDALLDL